MNILQIVRYIEFRHFWCTFNIHSEESFDVVISKTYPIANPISWVEGDEISYQPIRTITKEEWLFVVSGMPFQYVISIANSKMNKMDNEAYMEIFLEKEKIE